MPNSTNDADRKNGIYMIVLALVFIVLAVILAIILMSQLMSGHLIALFLCYPIYFCLVSPMPLFSFARELMYGDNIVNKKENI